ncbi:MAG: protein kinase [Bacteroidales bacterium]|nr:protein kinase [Bacteroidales bacterium]
MQGYIPNIVPERHICKVGEIINSRYTIVSLLGEGSFGHVFMVKDFSGREFALKLLHLWDVPSDIRQPLIDRFEMEYRTGRIVSDYLVHSVDIGYLAGNPYIVMEYCSGGDLSSRLGDGGVQTLRYARDILRGLNDLHINGKVHRDLKPENVLIKSDGIAALTDFGISGDRNKRMTERNIFGRPYQVFGTYAYMPPEQVNRARGGSTVLPTTDVFSFGVLLYQMITGKLPFGKLESQNDLVWYQKKGKAGDWDKITLYNTPNGKCWEPVIEGCLQPDYKNRLQNAAAVMELLPDFGLVNNQSPNTLKTVNVSNEGDVASIRGCRIMILQGLEYGKIYDLSAMVKQNKRFLLTLGRGEDNSIQLMDYQSFYTSRYHCTIEIGQDLRSATIRDGQWDVESRCWRSSSNGTYVNSTEVSSVGQQLREGDIITIGEITIRFESY